MSCNYHVFLGPYLEVHNPIRKTTEKIRSCANEKCKRHKKQLSDSSAQFCPSCGEKIRHVDIPCEGRKEFNIYDEFKKERLTELSFEGMPDECENYMYFHSNLRDCAGRTFYDNTMMLPMNETTPLKEIAEFTARFGDEIQHITKIFGAENVKIRWGAFAYWS
jgi:ribosomal protein L32